MFTPSPGSVDLMKFVVQHDIDTAVQILLRVSPETAKMYAGPKGADLVLALQAEKRIQDVL